MPEAGIDENDDSGAWDGQVRRPVDAKVLSVPHASAPQGLPERALYRTVPLLDAGHDSAPGFAIY